MSRLNRDLQGNKRKMQILNGKSGYRGAPLFIERLYYISWQK
jgi:hypothetical protein